MQTSTEALLQAALDYAKAGWPIFPCHRTGHQPLDSAKDSQGRGGFYLATTNKEQIQAWWSRWPDAAIGLRTGQASGVFVMDIDPRHGGDILFEELEASRGPLPHTVESQTGGGGRHIYFQWPSQPVRCSTSEIASDIDIKGDGGYVILPPSDHKSRSWTYELLHNDNLEACYARGREKLVDQPERLTKLIRLGRERALFYLLAVSTGLRRKELASVTLGQVYLEAVSVPHIQLHAHQAKSGKEATLPLRPDVAKQIHVYLQDRDSDTSLDNRLFDHPPTIRIFDADCQAAGIPKTDERSRVVDIHALRTTFGTYLAVAGVAPRVAQAAMRHSRIELTTHFYTDPILLDVNGAMNALPDFTAGTVDSFQSDVV